jgi:hypothetical protein
VGFAKYNVADQISRGLGYKPAWQTISILFTELKSVLALSFKLLAVFDNLNGI